MSVETEAVDRWTDDGGAGLVVRSIYRTYEDSEVIVRLGRAVVKHWPAIPTATQGDLFRTAASESGYKTEVMSQRIALFLHRASASRL